MSDSFPPSVILNGELPVVLDTVVPVVADVQHNLKPIEEHLIDDDDVKPGDDELTDGDGTKPRENHLTRDDFTIAPGLSEHLNNRLSRFRQNRYVTRKTAAQGMMDVALLLANASQLKSVVETGPAHIHYAFLMILICLSISLQIITGVVLIAVGSREMKSKLDKESMDRKTNRLNNLSVVFILLITVINIFITSFGIRDRDNP